MTIWYKNIRIVESADMNFEDRPTSYAADTFPCYGGSTVTAKCTTHTFRGRVDFALNTGELYLIGHVSSQGHNWPTSVPAATLTMAMVYTKCVAYSFISHCAAHAAARHFHFVGHLVFTIHFKGYVTSKAICIKTSSGAVSKAFI